MLSTLFRLLLPVVSIQKQILCSTMFCLQLKKELYRLRHTKKFDGKDRKTKVKVRLSCLTLLHSTQYGLTEVFQDTVGTRSHFLSLAILFTSLLFLALIVRIFAWSSVRQGHLQGLKHVTLLPHMFTNQAMSIHHCWQKRYMHIPMTA